MANTFVTPTMIAQRALATLYNTTVLAGLISRDFDQDFMGKQGDTVNVRVPAVFTADDFNRVSGITIQDASENRFPVVLKNIADVSFDVTSEELLLDIDDFAARLLDPAMEAINQHIDGDLADTMISAAGQAPASGGDFVQQQSGGGTVTSAVGGEPIKALVAARTKLGRKKLPTQNRYAVFSPEGSGSILNGELVVQANFRGDTDGLVEAAVGRKFGFDTFESQVLGDNKSGSGRHAADGVAFHRDAIMLANRTLPIPLGKRDSNGDIVGAAIAQYKGMGLRVVYDYDVTHKQDVVSIDFLYGTRAIRPYGAVQLNLGVS